MTNIRRYKHFGDIYFVTNVTYNRRPLLIDHVDLLWRAVDACHKACPFVLLAWVILPDHFHAIIDTDGFDISGIMQRVKMSFATSVRHRLELRSGRVWQHRFWDHVIRDQDDMNRHLEYIHYNPVKHGLVRSPFDWVESSIHQFVVAGAYAPDWGKREDVVFEGDYGE